MKKLLCLVAGILTVISCAASDKEMPISWHTGAAGAFHAWLGINRETGAAAAVGINYGLVNAEELGFAILRNLPANRSV